MSGFLSKIFGRGTKKAQGEGAEIIDTTLKGIVEKAGLDLSFEVTEQDENYRVELSGGDEELLTERDGQLLDSMQFLVKRVLQHRLPESRIDVHFDSNGYREQASQELIDLAEKLKSVVIEKGKSVYFRALPPKDRKIIHQYLADDQRVRSRSVGDGHFKKIKIFPAGQDRGRRNEMPSETAE